MFNKEKIEKIKERLNPENEKNMALSETISVINTLILLWLILGNLPNLIDKIYEGRKLFGIIFWHCVVWIMVPILLRFLTPFLKDIYNIIKKDYRVQLALLTILWIWFFLFYSADLKWLIETIQ